MKNFLGIKEVKERTVYYVRKYGSYHIGGPKAYFELREFISKNKLEIFSTNKNIQMFGIPRDNPCITPSENCRYDCCITHYKHVPVAGNVNIQTIPGGKYAAFLHKGPYEEVGSLLFAIKSQWAPDNNYEEGDTPIFFVYLNPLETTKPEDLRAEIHFPIK